MLSTRRQILAGTCRGRGDLRGAARLCAMGAVGPLSRPGGPGSRSGLQPLPDLHGRGRAPRDRHAAGAKARPGSATAATCSGATSPTTASSRGTRTTGAVSVFRQPVELLQRQHARPPGTADHLRARDRRVTRTEYDGTITVLADRFEGKRSTRRTTSWSTPTIDLVHRSALRHPAATTRATRASRELPKQRLPLRSGDRHADVAVADICAARTASCFSPDETKLYVVEAGASPSRRSASTTSGDGTSGREPPRRLIDCRPGGRPTASASTSTAISGAAGAWAPRLDGVGLRPERQADRPDPPARALRQRLLRRGEAQSPVHGGEPVGLRDLHRGAGRRRRLV